MRMLDKKKTHIKIFILFFLANCIFLACFSCVAKAIEKNVNQKMQAIVRSDNDYVTYDDENSPKENIPEIVELKIRSILKECKIDNIRYDKSTECKYFVFKVKHTDSISIYIPKIYLNPSIRYYFIAYDSKTFSITNNSPWIYGVYMENNEDSFNPVARMLEKPLISFDPFVLNNTKGTMVVKERLHNGTFNSIVDDYYLIGNNMNLNKLMSIESKAFTLGPEGNDCLIIRSLKDNIITNTFRCENKTPELMGRVKVEITENNVRIVSKEGDKYKNILVTVMDVDEGSFLNGK